MIQTSKIGTVYKDSKNKDHHQLSKSQCRYNMPEHVKTISQHNEPIQDVIQQCQYNMEHHMPIQDVNTTMPIQHGNTTCQYIM